MSSGLCGNDLEEIYENHWTVLMRIIIIIIIIIIIWGIPHLTSNRSVIIIIIIIISNSVIIMAEMAVILRDLAISNEEDEYGLWFTLNNSVK